MKLLKLLSFLTIIGLLSSISLGQTIHQVVAGDSTLAAAIADAADGDIIELITDGGVYTNPNRIYLDKSLEIRAHATLVNKPIVKYTGSSTSMDMFRVEGSPKLVFKGLDLDGDGTTHGAAGIAKYIFRIDTGDSTGTVDLRVYDCILHDTSDKLVKPYPYSGIDTLMFHYTTFYNGGREGVVLNSGSSSDPKVFMDYAEFMNCTFYSITREAIKGDTNPDTELLVNHCTFYDVGGLDKPFIWVDDALNVAIKNCVFQKNLEVGNFIRLEGPSNTVNNIVFWDVVDFEIDNATVTDTLYADPLFADPMNADFTLDMSSPALYFADDGSTAGDLRWDPTVGLPKTFYVESGTDVLSPVIDMASDGDTIEFVTSGGLYLSTERLVLDKSLVFRARAGIAEKPILQYIGSSTSMDMFRVEGSPKLVFKGLDLDGDGTPQGAAAIAKYIFRIDTGDSTGTADLRVYDCLLHDTSDKLVKPYPYSGIDTLMFHYTTFYNGGREGVVLNSGSSSDPKVFMDYAEFMNCTFYSITREAIKGDTNPDTELLVNQCTFYDIGGLDKPFIWVDDALNVAIKNSVFQKNLEVGNFIRLEGPSNTVNNIVFWDVVDFEIDNATVTDTLYADPLFADPMNADFTLDASSPARTAGEGGTPAGDLRWAIDPNSVLLSVVTVGQGIVTLDPPGNIYDPGTMVTLTAIPDLGWEFEGWSGDDPPFPPDLNPRVVTISSNMTVIATFVNLTPQVTLTIDSIGLGSVVANPEPGDDGTYDLGETVELTAVPAVDWAFVEWLGDVTSTDNPVTFTVDSNMTVTASFQSTLTQFSLNTTIVGNGNVLYDPEPVIDTYDTNTVVHLTAVPAIGWLFEGWTGDLTSTSVEDSVTMDSDKNITTTFIEEQVPGGILVVDDSWDLKDAVDFANNNSGVHTLELTTSGGLYTSTSTADVAVMAPLVIRAAEGLAEKPIITNSDTEGGNDDIFRVFDDFSLKGVVMDGGHEQTHGMKYGIRLRDYTSDSVKTGTNIHLDDVDFIDFFENKGATADGHAFNIQTNVKAGDVLIENCTFKSLGYEAIRISDTEKWPTDGALESLTIRNCTFTDIDAEGIRYYSDLDPLTPDAPLIIEHLTFENSATRTMFLKNSGGAIVRDIIIANSRLSGHGRDGDLMDAQGNTDVPSYVSYIDTFNVNPVPIKSSDGEVDSTTIYGIDPEFEDPSNLNYTLLETSHLYGLGSDGEAIGDLNWATNVAVNKTLTVTIDGNGSYTTDPPPIGNSYDPGTVVSVTAVPDSGYMFVEWTGDIASTDNPLVVTLTESVSITAHFDIETGVDDVEIPITFSISQNYPNPFNPTTTIRFGLPVEARVSLRIYNSIGEEIATLVNSEDMSAGYHNLVWNARNNNGVGLASGFYIYRIEAVGNDGKEFTQTMKMIFLK